MSTRLQTIDMTTLDAARGGLVRASSSRNDLMMQQMMMTISDSIRDVARQQNQASPMMMVAMLALAMRG